MGACTYVVSDENCNLLMAKSRVAPLKEITIPRMELTAAVLGSRLGNYIQKAYSEEVYFDEIRDFIDSWINLCWLTSKQDHKDLYIRNRVAEFKIKLPKAILHHIKTEENPADLIT